ncbi:hypothetical protein K1719_024392 [Acacia pycnantha]|nr:hypothetical protein K1719_024392 [Acacia pycnantha]
MSYAVEALEQHRVAENAYVTDDVADEPSCSSRFRASFNMRRGPNNAAKAAAQRLTQKLFLPNWHHNRNFHIKKPRNSFRVQVVKPPPGVEFPKVQPQFKAPFLGFTKTAEIWNSSACMIGIIGVFIVELVSITNLLQIVQIITKILLGLVIV